MFPTILTVSVALIASLAYLFSAQQSAAEPRVPYVQGRNNTALFIANYEHGLSNVFIATANSMLENHPEIEINYASWAKVKRKTDRISKFAKEKNPAAQNVIFHELKGQGYADAVESIGMTMDSAMNEPGWRGIGNFASNMQAFICPWEPEPFFELYTEIMQLIDEIDPAVVVVDTIFRPAIDATRDKHRQHVMLTPNTHVDNFLAIQPYGGMFWKYPAMSSGFQFPLKWSQVVENVYINARYIYAVMAGPSIRRKQAALKEYGVKEPIDFMHMHRPDVPWITMHTEGASIPVDVVPENVTSAGPIIVYSAPAEKQDPELVAWMKRAPTVLVNLGSSVMYSEERAIIFAAAIADILEQSNVQIIWKFNKYLEYSDDYLMPLKPYLGDRLLMPDWLGADPYALLETGLISVSVHHGGSGCYHEAISAGVAQVVLPLWADLYSFAALAETLDVGHWACRETSPYWTRECLRDGILHGINNLDFATHAKALGETVRARGKGRDIAAAEVAKYARVAS